MSNLIDPLKPIEFVKKFLELNGFLKITEDIFKWGQYYITIEKDHYWIHTKDCDVYSSDLNIYWLIGYLTYYHIIDKNYKLPE